MQYKKIQQDAARCSRMQQIEESGYILWVYIMFPTQFMFIVHTPSALNCILSPQAVSLILHFILIPETFTFLEEEKKKV